MRPIYLCALLVLSAACKQQRPAPPLKPKSFAHRGATLAHIHQIEKGYGSLSAQNMHQHLLNVGFNAVQINTFAYQDTNQSTKLSYNSDPSMPEKNIRREIRNLKKVGLKVMLKPHVWVGGWPHKAGMWRNKIAFDNKTNVNSWFKNYTRWILQEAKLAQEENVDTFVVGTELVEMAKYEKRWRKIIRLVRNIYPGKITYACEGWNAQNIKFWDELDYIGINSYFTLSSKANPKLRELTDAWAPYVKKFDQLHNKYKKPILFTEFGYKSHQYATFEPWKWEQNHPTSQEVQKKAFLATYFALSQKEYFAGLYVWKYFTDNNSYESANIEKGFTPYNKEAESVLSTWFLLQQRPVE